MSVELLNALNGAACDCGKQHTFDARLVIGAGVLPQLTDILAEYGAKKVFVLSDKNTYAAAGETVCGILQNANIETVSFSFQQDAVEPDEHSVGAAVMHFDPKCQVIVGVGSGVINDIGKILSHISGKPYIIVATAPSMDGYASASSSMTRNGLKISLPSRCADGIIGDTDILCNAPLHMMKAGLGDMLAKYVSICEWRIAKIVAGEYYCPQVAQLIRSAVKGCVDHAGGLLQRDPAAVQAVFEGLVIGGVAMNYAGLSRPASGVEHYISHVLDMRGVEFGTPVELHGIQCAVGTLIAVSLYEKLKTITPNKALALQHAAEFDYATWESGLRALLGNGAEAMIALEAKEQKYDLAAHARRLDIIIENWWQLLDIMEQELPAYDDLLTLLQKLGMPTTLEELGTRQDLFPAIFHATKDIRDKYVLSRLAWDLGVIDQLV